VSTADQVAPGLAAGAPAVEVEAARRPLPRKVIVGVSIIGVFALIAIFAPLLAPDDPNAQNVADRLQGVSAEHLLGTDQLGRDELSRLIYATRVDLPVAVLSVLLPALLGTFLGAIAAYRGGLADSALMGVSSIFQAFPLYVFLIAVVFALGSGVGSVLVAFTVINWVVYQRLIRGEILRIRGLEYVQAAEAAGISRRRILSRHVMPNAISQTYVYMSSDVVLAMIGFATLSFFGLGVSPPTAEWGAMVQQGQEYLRTDPQISILPGLAIIALGSGFALLGDGLDDYLRR
jgi:peptide/nickel transport system permease protein